MLRYRVLYLHFTTLTYITIISFLCACAANVEPTDRRDRDTSGSQGNQANNSGSGNDGGEPPSPEPITELSCDEGWTITPSTATTSDSLIVTYSHPSIAYTYVDLRLEAQTSFASASFGDVAIDGGDPPYSWTWPVSFNTADTWTIRFVADELGAGPYPSCQVFITQAD